MTLTPDRRPGESDEEGIVFENLTPGSDPSSAGGVRFVNGSFSFRDALGLFDPRTGSGLSAAQHKALRQLVHLASGGGPFEGFASGAYRQILPAGSPFPTSVIWWVSNALTQKIVEKLITRNSNQTPSQIQWKVYDTDGTTLLATVTDTLTYVNGVFEATRTRAIA